MAGGVHVKHAHPFPGLILRDKVGQCASGTHPTGMHSCFFSFQILCVLCDVLDNPSGVLRNR